MKPLGATIGGLPARSRENRLAFVFLLAAILPAIQRCSGPVGQVEGLNPLAPLFVTTFVLFGILPALVIRILLNERLADYGLQIGDARGGLRAIGILLPVAAVAICLPASRLQEIRLVYPFDRTALLSVEAFVRLELARGLLFYTAWEFFYRGFILFALRPLIGDRGAILAQTIPSCLWHIGRPPGELIAAIPAGIVFGTLALRTRSILWPFLLHLGIGVFLDLWICLG